MTTFTLNTMLRGTKAAFLAFTLVIASFGAGCEGAEGFEGDEDGMEQVGETEQALKGAIGLAPAKMKQKCEAAGRVYDPSTNGCSQTCAPGLVAADANGFKCVKPVDPFKACLATGMSLSQCAPCMAGYPKGPEEKTCPVAASEGSCLAAGNYWSQAGKTCHTTGSTGHYDALCKHNDMEYDPSKKGQTFPCKVADKPSSTGGSSSPPASSCIGSFDCMAVFCNYPGNENWQACKNIETIPGWITGG